mmetsp:Transcript_851/g.1026  ORF Transcript_851/g.1026 Transcript_851/m.1026 type:complete len:257 (+) Transcript_851:958-1728(+)
MTMLARRVVSMDGASDRVVKTSGRCSSQKEVEMHMNLQSARVELCLKISDSKLPLSFPTTLTSRGVKFLIIPRPRISFSDISANLRSFSASTSAATPSSASIASVSFSVSGLSTLLLAKALSAISCCLRDFLPFARRSALLRYSVCTNVFRATCPRTKKNRASRSEWHIRGPFDLSFPNVVAVKARITSAHSTSGSSETTNNASIDSSAAENHCKVSSEFSSMHQSPLIMLHRRSIICSKITAFAEVASNFEILTL